MSGTLNAAWRYCGRIRLWVGNLMIEVERYDRVMHQRRLIRVHQEDICQALGIHPTMKYQNEGGPDTSKMMELMNRSSQPVEDRRRLMEAIAFNYLI